MSSLRQFAAVNRPKGQWGGLRSEETTRHNETMEKIGKNDGVIGEASRASETWKLRIFALGTLALAGAATWDHLGSTALQRMAANEACVQLAQSADVEFHEFKSGYPGGLGDVVNEHVKIAAQYQCGEAVKTIEQWDDARGAMRSDGSRVDHRTVKSLEELDLLNWRKAKSGALEQPPQPAMKL